MVAEDENYILLDGHNNPGFSGGPVIFKKNNHGKNFIVAGVVSGYHFAREPVYENEEQEQKESPMGYYKSNTGIIIVYNIEHALSLIPQKSYWCKIRNQLNAKLAHHFQIVFRRHWSAKFDACVSSNAFVETDEQIVSGQFKCVYFVLRKLSVERNVESLFFIT